MEEVRLIGQVGYKSVYSIGDRFIRVVDEDGIESIDLILEDLEDLLEALKVVYGYFY